jgi:hypothetical protein
LFNAQKSHDERVTKSLQEASKATQAFAAAAPASSAPQPGPNTRSGTFFRPPRPEVIECNADKNVIISKKEVDQVFKGLLAEKGLDCKFETFGRDETARRFLVSFPGPGTVPKEIVDTLLRARKGPDGKFKYVPIKDPHGDEHKLYFGADKSSHAKRVETVTKKFGAILEAAYPDKSFGVRREAGVISLQGSRLAFVEATQEKVKLSWNARTLPESGIDKDSMASKFESEFNVEWSS